MSCALINKKMVNLKKFSIFILFLLIMEVVYALDMPSISGLGSPSEPLPWEQKGCPKYCLIKRTGAAGTVGDIVVSPPGELFACFVNSKSATSCTGVLRYNPGVARLFQSNECLDPYNKNPLCKYVPLTCGKAGSPGPIAFDCQVLYDVERPMYVYEGSPCSCNIPPPAKPPTPPPPKPQVLTPFCPSQAPPAPRPPSGPLTAEMTDEQICRTVGIFVLPTCDNQCKTGDVCKEKGVDAPNRRVRCYYCIPAPKKLELPEGFTAPDVKREKPVLYPFGDVVDCKKVQTFSKFQSGGEQCVKPDGSTCPSDMDCRVVDVCAGGVPSCPPGKPRCERGEKLCSSGNWISCYNCERKMRLIEVNTYEEKEVKVGEVSVEKQVFKAEIPTEVIGICNEASKQYDEMFDSKISPPTSQGCDSGCKQVRFNVPSGSAKCCCCGPCKPVKAPTAPVQRATRPSPEQVCAHVQKTANDEGKPLRVELPKEGAVCDSGCKLQDFKIGLCCLCPVQ